MNRPRAAPRTILLAGLLAALVIALDQVSKAAVRAHIAVGEAVDVLGPFKLTQAHNDGVAFGLAGGGGILVILLSLLALVALGFFLVNAPRRRWMWVAVGLIVGGALGNLVDRIRFGQVTDFLVLPNWPAFNLADTAITLGVIALALILIREEPG